MITKRFFINYVSVHASIKLSNMTNCSESYSTTHGRPRLTAGNPTFFSAKFPAGLVLKKVTRALESKNKKSPIFRVCNCSWFSVLSSCENEGGRKGSKFARKTIEVSRIGRCRIKQLAAKSIVVSY